MDIQKFVPELAQTQLIETFKSEPKPAGNLAFDFSKHLLLNTCAAREEPRGKISTKQTCKTLKNYYAPKTANAAKDKFFYLKQFFVS